MPRPSIVHRRLPVPCRALLAIGSRLVPPSLRGDWTLEWEAELVHARSGSRSRPPATDLRLLRRSLGSLTDAVRIRTHEWSFDMLLQDLRFALRTHRKQPGFTFVAVATLTLGIGANTALFSLVNGILLEALPYPEPERLVRLYGTNTSRGLTRSNMNPLDLMDLRAQADTLEELTYVTATTRTLTGNDRPLRLVVGLVATSYFDTLGVQPELGRGFLPDEHLDGRHRVVVLSQRAWRDLFAADADIVGRKITLTGEPYMVVGVAPGGFAGPVHGALDMWQPWPVDPEADGRGGHFMKAIARLSSGTSLQQAQQEIDAVFAGIAEIHDKPDRGVVAMPLHTAVTGAARPLLLTLLGAVAFVLLIVCANVANLLLARSSGRQQEVAVRMALGAGRGRLVRQLITETLMLSLAGGLLGVAFAHWLVTAGGGLVQASLPRQMSIGIDVRVLLFTAALSVGTGLLFGMAPALQATRSQLADALRDGGQGAATRPRRRLRGALVVAEVSLSLMLLIGAGLMLRSFARLSAVDPGFDAASLTSVRLSVPAADYPETATVPTFYGELIERIRRLPGVTATGATNRLPFSGSYSCDLFVLEGWPMPEPGRGECAEERVLNADYFETMGIELLAGRWFDERDTADAEQAVVISRTMAETFMPGEDPIGRGFKWGLPDERPFRRVVGVVEDIKHVDLQRESMTEVYMPHSQYPFYRTLHVVVRHDGNTAPLVAAIRAELAQMDPDIPLFDVASMQDRLDASTATQRYGATLLGAFAVLALVLASVGLYGVLAFTVSQRTREIGLRMALGARATTVRGMVVRSGMTLVAGGIGAGLLGAYLLSGAIQGLLYEVEATDPATFVAVAAALLAVALVASYLPARRATTIDPMRALKE